MNYYNEFDPKAAAWLRELIKQGLIPNGHVDERSIADIKPGDLAGYTQCHFFAGIGGWSLALQLAGWPADKSVWTGSCPCQPFSTAGANEGQEDPRHLWPAFFRLISEYRHDHVFGEQVENAIGHGWLDGVQTDLEGEGYAIGHCVLGAHSVGAPHIRQRLYWVANSIERPRQSGESQSSERPVPQSNGSGDACSGLAITTGKQPHRSGDTRGGRGELADDSSSSGVAHTGHMCGRGWPQSGQQAFTTACNGGQVVGMDNSQPKRLEGLSLPGGIGQGNGEGGRSVQLAQASGWHEFGTVPCLDGKARRIGTGVRPLAHGVPGRVGLLRGYGNAIVPAVAAEFIKAFLG